jgi:peptide/nickel transport system substrate-binding protein
LKVALLLLAVTVGCQSAPGPAPPASPTPSGVRGGTLVLADWEFPDSLDPLHATTQGDLRVAGLIFEPLWTLGPDLGPLPRLLREVPSPANGEVKLNADGRGMTVDLKLRQGPRWSDGTPITADDLIFSVDAICSATLPGRDRSGFDHIASQERRSDTEVVWHFGPRPAGACGLSSDLASGLYPAWQLLGPRAVPLPAHRLAATPLPSWPSDPYFQSPDVVSGPFAIRGVVPGQLIDLVADPQYPSGRTRGPWLDGITYRFYGGKAAFLAGLQAGDADLAFHLLPEDEAQLSGIPRSQTLVTPTLQGEFLVPNQAVNVGTGREPPWFGDPTALRALVLGIDRTALDRAAFGGEAAITPGLYPALLKDYSVTGPAPGGSSAEAKALLDGDGWRAGPDGTRIKAGRPLAFTLLTVCDSDPRQAEQAELVRQWGQLGAAVTAGCEPRAGFFAGYAQGGVLARGGFDIALYSNSWQPDPDAWAPFATTAAMPGPANPSGLNWESCSDPRLDQDFAAGEATLDPAKRQASYRDAAGRWLLAGCSIPLYEWPSVVRRSTRLHGFEPNPIAGLDSWNAADWWLSAP